MTSVFSMHSYPLLTFHHTLGNSGTESVDLLAIALAGLEVDCLEKKHTCNVVAM